MKKQFILISLILTSHSSHALILDRLLNIQGSAEKIRLAANDLEQYSDQITTFRRTIYAGRDVVTLDDYWCESLAARKSIHAFKSEEELFILKIMLSHLFDSIILGQIAGYCHRKFNVSTLAIVCGVIATSLGIVAHQNHTLKDVPYFDFNLKRYENRFENFDFLSAVRFVFIAIEAGIITAMTSDFCKQYVI